MNIETFQRTKIGPLSWLLFAMLAGWLLARVVLQGESYLFIPAAIGTAAVVLIQTLRNWRFGVLIFITWLLFEDLVRKFLGNNMAVYFAKDVLAALCVLSYYLARRRERVLRVRPGFFLPLIIFFAWSLLEVFNPLSPSMWYGLLGLKLYFSYVPLFFLGYGFLRSEADLQRLLLLNVKIAAVIAALGVAQAIMGQTLFAPADLAPEISELGSLMRRAPTGENFLRPASVFVSDGRYAEFLILAWLLTIGVSSYLFVRHLPARKWVLGIMGLLAVAIFLSGARGALMYALISTIVIVPLFAREMFWMDRRARRIGKAVIATLVFGVFAVIVLSVAYPEAVAPRLSFYQATLLPSSAGSEFAWRVWGYPAQEFMKALAYPYWALGYGTGTCSLGGQYLTRILSAPGARIGVESGYGNLMLETGVPGLALWLIWTGALLVSGWRVVSRLRGTALFPVGFVIFWFSFIILFPSITGGLTTYQNFVMNAYLWLLLGVLFSLPALAEGQGHGHQAAGIPVDAGRPGVSRYVTAQ